MPQPMMYGPPRRPEDEIADFLALNGDSHAAAMDANAPVRLAALRNTRRRELEDQVAQNPQDAHHKILLKFLDQDMADDPFTGDEAQAREKYVEDALTKANTETLDPVADSMRHKEAIALQQTLASHPNPNVMPFSGSAAPAVPGAVPVGRGGPSMAPASVTAGSAPHGVPAPPGIDPQKWAAQTADLTPDTASKLAAVLQYDQSIPSGNVLARPEWSTIMGRTKQIDPTFDAKQFDTRKAYLSSYAKSNLPTSLDTVMHHLDSFNTAAEGLHNTGVKPWNYLTNQVLDMTVGNPAMKTFDDRANAVAGELSNIFKATGATDQEIKSWRDNLSASATPEEFHQQLQGLTDLIRGRLEAIQNRYQTVTGRQSPQLLSDESRAIWERFNKPAGASAAPQGRVSVKRIG